MLFAKDGTRTAVAFTFRRRSKAQSLEVSVRVKTSAWNTTPYARVLGLFSVFLPPEYRSDYVEEQYANILQTESGRESFEYLLDLILELPRVAWQFYAERKRESAK